MNICFKIISSSALISIFVLILFSSGCLLWGSPAINIVIENKTQSQLTVFFNDYKIGEIKPDSEITKTTGRDTAKYLIEARNPKGDTIYSKEFTLGELDNLNYKVVIK
jgi:hypothetical protein